MRFLDPERAKKDIEIRLTGIWIYFKKSGKFLDEKKQQIIGRRFRSVAHRLGYNCKKSIPFPSFKISCLKVR
jgi:hypothetical protein